MNMSKQNNENLETKPKKHHKVVSHSYDPSMTNQQLKEVNIDKSESDLLSINKSLDFSSYRAPFRMKTNDFNTLRESDYSWNQKSNFDYDSEALILGSALHNASQTQDMIKEFLDSETNGRTTARDNADTADLKEEINTTRDKIHRSIEDYKEHVQKLTTNVEYIENQLGDLDDFQQGVEHKNAEYKQHFGYYDPEAEEKPACINQLLAFEVAQEEKLHQITLTEDKMYEKDRECQQLSDSLRDITRKFETVRKDLLKKVRVT